jgi:hypothetical protein
VLNLSLYARKVTMDHLSELTHCVSDGLEFLINKFEYLSSLRLALCVFSVNMIEHRVESLASAGLFCYSL